MKLDFEHLRSPCSNVRTNPVPVSGISIGIAYVEILIYFVAISIYYQCHYITALTYTKKNFYLLFKNTSPYPIAPELIIILEAGCVLTIPGGIFLIKICCPQVPELFSKDLNKLQMRGGVGGVLVPGRLNP
ncbi:hypothetical protein CEXT_346701 [Caerostris extrusa]|uniref:Uncharacterized protein n=1 Tax=Caerostris extrusa TaxID=172846 RepID=A0AAV4P1V7_CAEEX|nr:hypothetical protein CEXT_346701 [Caerostris extrusa]